MSINSISSSGGANSLAYIQQQQAMKARQAAAQEQANGDADNDGDSK